MDPIPLPSTSNKANNPHNEVKIRQGPSGKITKGNARCSLQGDLMKPDVLRSVVRYDPVHISAFAADKATSILLFAHSSHHGCPIIQLYITSSFTTERYTYDKTVLVRQIPKLDGTYRHPDKPYGQLLRNLYGSKPACNIHY